MKNILFIVAAATFLCICGCTKKSSENKESAQVQINYPEIPLCDKLLQPKDTIVWQNFQIRNTSPTDLQIDKIEVRGNSTCAFKCLREPLPGETGMQPCPEESDSNPKLNMIVPPSNATAIRIEYTASKEWKDKESGYSDYSTLVITSNAKSETYGVIVQDLSEPDAGADTEEKGQPGITRILIPMCGIAITKDGPDCPAQDPKKIQQNLCGDPLPKDSKGCK